MEDLGLQERRQFKRFRHSEAVQYRPKDSYDVLGSLSQDISQGGLRITIPGFIPLNTEVMLSIQLATEQVVECLGKVVWVEKLPYSERYQAGLRFEDNDTIVNSRRSIEKFLEA